MVQRGRVSPRDARAYVLFDVLDAGLTYTEAAAKHGLTPEGVEDIVVSRRAKGDPLVMVNPSRIINRPGTLPAHERYRLCWLLAYGATLNRMAQDFQVGLSAVASYNKRQVAPSSSFAAHYDTTPDCITPNLAAYLRYLYDVEERPVPQIATDLRLGRRAVKRVVGSLEPPIDVQHIVPVFEGFPPVDTEGGRVARLYRLGADVRFIAHVCDMDVQSVTTLAKSLYRYVPPVPAQPPARLLG